MSREDHLQKLLIEPIKQEIGIFSTMVDHIIHLEGTDRLGKNGLARTGTI